MCIFGSISYYVPALLSLWLCVARFSAASSRFLSLELNTVPGIRRAIAHPTRRTDFKESGFSPQRRGWNKKKAPTDACVYGEISAGFFRIIATIFVACIYVVCSRENRRGNSPQGVCYRKWMCYLKCYIFTPGGVILTGCVILSVNYSPKGCAILSVICSPQGGCYLKSVCSLKVLYIHLRGCVIFSVIY